MNIILMAVPFFFLLIAIELIAERVKGTHYYRLNDAITSLTTGVISQLSKVVSLLVPLSFYMVVYQNFALFSLPDSWWVWVVAFVAYDLCYYWLHRYGHEMNILWAAHVVHHSSEEYNLTTALRQTGTGFLSFIFYLPLALIGFDPVMIVTVGALNLIYQYWVHTQHIGKLGWYEWFFVTPSNHRGHHAQNDVYLDKNYGGVFIIWDRMFGTFQEELVDDLPIYGIRGALSSWNPLWANWQVYHYLLEDCINTKSWWYKLTIWFRRTGWRPPDVIDRYPRDKTDLDNFKKYDTTLGLQEKVYAVVQYVLVTFLTLSLVANVKEISFIYQLLGVAFLLFFTFSNGAVLENKSFAKYTEAFKYGVLIVALWFVGNTNLAIISLSFAILSALIFNTRFLRTVSN